MGRLHAQAESKKTPGYGQHDCLQLWKESTHVLRDKKTPKQDQISPAMILHHALAEGKKNQSQRIFLQLWKDITHFLTEDTRRGSSHISAGMERLHALAKGEVRAILGSNGRISHTS
jgi:hypothetical protein